MKKQKSGSVWMILPLYIFTLIFVAGPLLYMVALSFAQPKAGHGVEWIFTLDNYRKIFDPVYMKTFTFVCSVIRLDILWQSCLINGKNVR